MRTRKWNLLVIGATIGMLLLIASITIFVDPFFHYHAGQSFLEYPLKDERYQNDGIARNYEYDSIIAGTSMCQNFLCSEFDELWGAKTVKLTTSGATYHESNANIRRALSYNEDVNYVVCSLDGNKLNYEPYEDDYEGYPEYLYDINPFNDVNYLLNKDIIPKTLAVLNYTRAGNITTNMDEYSSWGRYKVFGKDSVLSTFTLVEEREEELFLSEEDIQRIRTNVTENFLQTARMYPDTTFYLFFPPYSVCYWEALVRTKQLGVQIEAQKIAVEVLLTADNIQVYDFSHRTDITGNLENYTDTLHYGDWINSDILKMIRYEENRLLKENFNTYYDELKILYETYDYSLYRLEEKKDE